MTQRIIESPSSFPDKLRGEAAKSSIAYPGWREVGISALGGALIIAILSFLTDETAFMAAFIVPFGATAVLVFAAPTAPFSQPRNFIGGHLISGLSGVLIFATFGETAWWTLALANGLAIGAMVATKTVHPPAGATSLLPVVGGISSVSWLFSPVLIGCLVILIVALFYNNGWAKRKYPSFWI